MSIRFEEVSHGKLCKAHFSSKRAYLPVSVLWLGGLMSELMKTIRATMKQKNISQRDMAHRCGVTAVSISRWFNGERFPSLVALERIAKELDMEIVIQPRHPKWIHENDDQFDWCVCSECGYGNEGEVFFGQETPFCPYCGAKLQPPD